MEYEKFIALSSRRLLQLLAQEIDTQILKGKDSDEYKKIRNQRIQFEKECCVIVGGEDEKD